jgi:Zn-dependent peptidase ImmA (M78 family)
LFDAARQQPDLFGTTTAAPSIACRAGDKESIEWQADAFAGLLLMPEAMVRAAWLAARGSVEPYIAAAEMAALAARWSLAEDHTPTVAVAREMAGLFKVSGQAMQIRLLDLGLIKPHAPAANLFTAQEKTAINA